jgi:aryl-alcohol dehydrogenase-like predicted oxidoreductase
MSDLDWPIERCITFGRTAQTVLPLGLGTHGHGHAFGGTTESESMMIMTRVAQSTPAGAKILVDTAPRYGHGDVESWIGKLGSSDRARILVASKGGRHIEPERDNEKDFTADFLRRGLEDSLTRLGLQKMFLYQLHNPTLQDIRAGRIFEVLESLREIGLVDWYGISIDNAEEGNAVLDYYERYKPPGLVAIQAIFSVLTKSICGPMFARAAALDLSIVGREVLVRGLLTNSSLLYDEPGATAVTKLVQAYGRDQLERRRADVVRIAQRSGLDIAEAAIGFSASHPHIAVTLVGCNRLNFLREDWGHRAKLDPRTYDELFCVADLRPQAQA